MDDLASAQWIFLRGLAREAGHWGTFLDAWRAHLPASEVVLVDLPGFGSDHRGRSPFTIGEILAAVRARIGAIAGEADPGTDADVVAGTRRRRAILGLSLGGMVAYEWLRRYPDELAGVVLVNASLGGLSPPWERLRLRAVGRMLGAALAPNATRREARLYKMVSNRPEVAEQTAQAWAEIGRARPVRPVNAFAQLVAAVRYAPTTPAPTEKGNGERTTTLVLASGRDRMVNPDCSRRVAASLRAELREHPSAGHDLPLDDPDWVAAEVARWIAARSA